MKRAEAPDPSGPAAGGPRPAAVRGNNWREVGIPPIEEFTPVLWVSVVVPYY